MRNCSMQGLSRHPSGITRSVHWCWGSLRIALFSGTPGVTKGSPPQASTVVFINES